MKTMNRGKITYVDAQAMAVKHPKTFEVPSTEELASIEPGCFVKVCTGRERFWVLVTKIRGNIVTGKVDNKLFTVPLRLGQSISFDKKNIYSVMGVK